MIKDNNLLPKRLERNTIYESDYICLYTDKVQLPSGYVIEKYHQLHYHAETRTNVYSQESII